MRTAPLALALLASASILDLAACGGGGGSGGVIASTPADAGPGDGGAGGGGGGGGSGDTASGGGATNSNTVEGGQSEGQSNSQSSAGSGGGAAAATAGGGDALVPGSVMTAMRGQGLETASPQNGEWRRHADGPDAVITVEADGGRTLTLPDGRQARLQSGRVEGGQATYAGTVTGSPGTTVTMQSSQGNLRYTDYGTWAEGGGVAAGLGVYAVGLPTTLSAMPTTGTADYQGGAVGIASVAGTNYTFTGTSALRADFAQGTITGQIAGLQARGAADGGPAGSMNDIALSGAIDGGGFSGTALPSSTPGQIDIGGTAGGFGGQFHGPDADEVGGTFALTGDGDMVAGSFGAARR